MGILSGGKPCSSLSSKRVSKHRTVSTCRSVASRALQSEKSAEVRTFNQLAEAFKIARSVQLKPGSNGLGLYSTRDAPKGSVLMSVPQSLCIYVDTETGEMGLPGGGSWPRLREGLGHEEALTWDLLVALALMDAVAGDGDPLWEAYADALLPNPELLTLPMCWSRELLQELQHEAIMDAALQQQARLQSLFPPSYMEPLGPGQPSWFQWAFACVRSRAFALHPGLMGLVPFMDFTNHNPQPNADFRLAPNRTSGPPTSSSSSSTAGIDPGSSSSGGSSSSAGVDPGSSSSSSIGGVPMVELVAVKDVAAGEEVLVSYSGPDGFTNQRFMATYGFAPRGNMADRLAGLEPSQGSSSSGLRLSYLQEALGDAVLMDAAQGRNPYLFAALKSLPLVDEQQQGPEAQGSALCASEQEKQLAAALLETVERELSGSSSTLQEDAALLAQAEGGAAGVGAPAPAAAAAAAAAGGAGLDVRQLAAVRYRVERKSLLQATQLLLKLFLR